MVGVFLPGSSKGGDITGVTAGVGLSGGGSSDDVTLTLDLSELSAVVPTSGDWFATLDSDEANEQLTTTDALATLLAGDGLTASSAVLAVNVDDSTIETNSDAIRIKDNGVSLAKMAGLTRGSIIYRATSGDPAALAKGNANEVLTSDGTDIAWAAASGVSLSGSTDNTVATVTGSNALAGEANLTFDGSTLAVTGAVTVSTDLTVSGGDIVYGNGQNATASVAATAHDAAGRNLTITAGPTTAGTSNNQAGGALTLQGGQGKGSGAGGDIIFQTANASGSGSSLNSHATALTLSDDLSATFAGAVDLGSNTLTSTGSMQIRTIDYSDGDLSMTIADGGGVTFAQAVTADAGVAIDNITIDGTEIDLSSGDLTLDVAGDIILDAGGVNVLPGADNTHDLGAAGTRWKKMYGQQFHMDTSADGIADHDYAGISITVRVGDGADIGAMDLVCISDVTNEVQVADADAIATSKVIGINPSNSAISDNSEGTILLFGVVRDDSWNWTTGQTLYLSTTAGDITATAPSGTDDCVVPIGVALEPDMIYFNPSQTIIEHA